MAIATVTNKGEITIPKEIREDLLQAVENVKNRTNLVAVNLESR